MGWVNCVSSLCFPPNNFCCSTSDRVQWVFPSLIIDFQIKLGFNPSDSQIRTCSERIMQAQTFLSHDNTSSMMRHPEMCFQLRSSLGFEWKHQRAINQALLSKSEIDVFLEFLKAEEKKVQMWVSIRAENGKFVSLGINLKIIKVNPRPNWSPHNESHRKIPKRRTLFILANQASICPPHTTLMSAESQMWNKHKNYSIHQNEILFRPSTETKSFIFGYKLEISCPLFPLLCPYLN